MIIDTHVHYTQPDLPHRPYDRELVKSHPELSPAPVPVEEVLTAAARAGVDKLVQVTQTRMRFDNAYSLEGAERYPEKILGVVGRFDPIAPDIERRLIAYFAPQQMLGVRLTLHKPPTTSWLRDRVLVPFFGVAEKLGALVQIMAPGQAAELRDAARRFPGIRFLIDHMTLEHLPPRPIEQVFENWPEVLRLAEEPNVWLKVSYFPEAASYSERFPYLQSKQFFRRLCERVGCSRLVWGSNYPPVAKACTYAEALDFIRCDSDFLTATQQDAILGENFLTLLDKKTPEARNR